jgi:Fur family peroxide stress response transcriptional regulator
MKKIDVDQAMKRFYQKCEEQGLKVTPQRVFIYEELLKATDHPSIDEIYQRVKRLLPNISFDTVYRTALSLTEKGIIEIVEGHSGSRRFDANTAQHHHFRCLKCHKIIDFESDYFDQVTIPVELQKRFHITGRKIMLEGVCDDCATHSGLPGKRQP